MTAALDGVIGQQHAPAALYPRERPGTHIYRRLGGSQGRSGRVRKLSPPPEFDPRTVQPVAIPCPGPKAIWMFVPISTSFIEIGIGVFILL